MTIATTPWAQIMERQRRSAFFALAAASPVLVALAGCAPPACRHEARLKTIWGATSMTGPVVYERLETRCYSTEPIGYDPDE